MKKLFLLASITLAACSPPISATPKKGSGCDKSKGTFACLEAALWKCDNALWVEQAQCGGADGCSVSGDTATCGHVVGDTCSAGFPDCSTDGLDLIECTAGKVAISRCAAGCKDKACSEVALTNLGPAMAVATCGWTYKCCSAAERTAQMTPGTSEATCRSAPLPNQAVEAMNCAAEIADYTFDPVTAKKCLDAYNNAACGAAGAVEITKACATGALATSKRTAGQDCLKCGLTSFTGGCATGLYCNATTMKCATYLALDADCTTGGQCDPMKHYCDGAKCTAYVAVGGDCAGFKACDPLTSYASDISGGPCTCTAKKDDGATCTDGTQCKNFQCTAGKCGLPDVCKGT
ncbi:MAG: hypothetical protein IT381_25530 [Deltaproteobacteria bacterium]|nr:hypothetical protein [Deltaproteobacteria bacterium]